MISNVIFFLLYIVIMAITYRVVWPDDPEPMDYFLIPVICVLWPLPWGIVVGNEIFGFFRNKIRNHLRAKRMVKNQKLHAARRAKAYKEDEVKYFKP